MYIKSGPEILAPLEADLARAGLGTDQLIFISFSTEIIAAVKKRFTDYKALWIVEFEPKKKGKAMRISASEILKELAAVRADGLDAQAHPVVDAAFVEAVRGAGFELHLWSEEDIPDLEPYADLQVESITCNFPGPLKEMLLSRGGEKRGARAEKP
jgi:glycerophosphoryl diester phosphodiesterase